MRVRDPASSRWSGTALSSIIGPSCSPESRNSRTPSRRPAVAPQRLAGTAGTPATSVMPIRRGRSYRASVRSTGGNHAPDRWRAGMAGAARSTGAAGGRNGSPSGCGDRTGAERERRQRAGAQAGSTRTTSGLLGALFIGLALFVGAPTADRFSGERGAWPPEPPNYQPRPELMERLRQALLGAAGGQPRRVGVCGRGGSGKSVLAAAASREREVRRR